MEKARMREEMRGPRGGIVRIGEGGRSGTNECVC